MKRTMHHIRPFSGLLALLLATALIYAQTLTHGFVSWDDQALIVENPIIRGLSWANIKTAFTSYDPELYVPLTTISYQVNYAIAGLQPWIYHATNLLLHLANIALVAGIALKLSKNRTVALLCAALFALHPLNVEAVAWASARKDVLSSFFFLLAVLFWLQRGKNRRIFSAASLAAYALGLLSKVSIVPLPLILLVLEWRENGKLTKRELLGSLPFFALSILFAIIALAGKVTDGAFVTEQLLIFARSVSLYLGKIFWPANLSPFYPYTHAISVLTPDILASIVLVLAVTGLCIWALKRTREPLFGWLWFLLLIAPGVANMARGHNELLDVYIGSDRYAYLGMIGMAWLVALSVEELRKRWPKTILATALAVTLTLGVLSVFQTMTWKDSDALFRHAVEASPLSYVAHTNLGTILVQRGDIEAGMAQYRKALAIRPDATTYYNVGQILEYQGRTQEAIAAYRKAVETSPLEADAQARLDALLGR